MLFQPTNQPLISGDFPIGWDLITTVVAVMALVQPWILRLIRRLFQAGSLEFYEAGKLVIQFGNICPAVELAGTFRAIHENQFLRSLDVTVEHVDGSSHSFEWESFRFHEAGPLGEQLPKFTLASSFMVTPTAPEHRIIVFFDSESRVKMEGRQEQVAILWSRYLEGHKVEVAADSPIREPNGNPSESNAAGSPTRIAGADANSMYVTFRETLEGKALYDALLHDCYWHVGSYTLTLNMNIDQLSRANTYAAQFSLSQGDVRKLHANIDSILRYWCGVPIPGVLQNVIIVPYTMSHLRR